MSHAGFDALCARSLIDVLWNRRTHRVSRGASVAAGAMSYTPAAVDPHPLDELEEALLIASTGCTGLTMPDRPFQDASGDFIMAKPNLTMDGRTAGGPDNAQGTHFFLINDTGTYFLKKMPPLPPAELTPETLIARAAQAKVKVLDRRLDVPDSAGRAFPAYLDSNRILSNLPGTTVLFPVVDLSHQYINGLMYILTQPEGARPTLVDDRNFYRVAGVRKWVKNGFLNSELKLPLGLVGMFRTQIEADLLLQNLMLVADAMGLGAWIHATMGPSMMLGDPRFQKKYGKMLGFEFHTPKWKVMDALRWMTFLPSLGSLRGHPVGLKHNGEWLIKCKCPPNYTIDEAVDDVVEGKFGAKGVYGDAETFRKIYRDLDPAEFKRLRETLTPEAFAALFGKTPPEVGNYSSVYLSLAEKYGKEVVECARDVCRYLYRTHGRFPAHCDAIHVPGVWIQVHHVDVDYYERFFRNGLTDAHRKHDERWHPKPPAPK